MSGIMSGIKCLRMNCVLDKLLESNKKKDL